MNLWCDIHMANHRFTPSAIERIVYALQGEVFDARRDERISADEMLMAEGERMSCPQDVLESAGSVEGRRELVDSMRDSRISEDRRRKPQLRGRPS